MKVGTQNALVPFPHPSLLFVCYIYLYNMYISIYLFRLLLFLFLFFSTSYCHCFIILFICIRCFCVYKDFDLLSVIPSLSLCSSCHMALALHQLSHSFLVTVLTCSEYSTRCLWSFHSWKGAWPDHIRKPASASMYHCMNDVKLGSQWEICVKRN